MQYETKVIDIQDINNSLPLKSTLLSFASFETRSTTFPLSLNDENVSASYIFLNKNAPTENNKLHADMINTHFSNAQIIEVVLNDPIVIADSLSKTLEEIICNKDTKPILIIDITTFTHEVLLILLKMVYNKLDKFESVFCVYTGAENYSIGDAPNQMWLSKGCKDIRNIFGYPGVLRPSEKTCLVILTGFELERATRLIELLEPDRLSLGSGEDPTSENHTAAMEYFRKEFEQWRKEYNNLERDDFSFSCKDINISVQEINKLISKKPDDNYILVPLNTKLSTIALSLLAFTNENLQLCYAVPETYNYKNYSTPGNKITILELKG